MKKSILVFTALFSLLLVLVGCKSKTSTKTYDMSSVSFNDETIEFDNQNHALEITGTLPEGVSVSYSENTFKEVGVHSITASFTGEKGYEAIPDMNATLTINKKELSLDKTSYSLKYNEEVQTINPIINGTLNDLPVEYTIDYSNEIKEVGNYTATVSLTSNTDIYTLKNNTIDINVSKEIFTITFKSPGKNNIYYNVAYGDNLENYDDPFAHEGYTTSWDQDISILQNIKENKIINVTLTPIEYEVTFNNNLPSGEDKTEKYNVNYDSFFENSANIMKDTTSFNGYIFKGWSTKRNGDVEFNLSDKYTIANNTTFYAIYDKKFIFSDSTLTGINTEYLNTDILDIPTKNYIWSENNVTSFDVLYINTSKSFYHLGCNNIKTVIIPYTIKSVTGRAFQLLTSVTNVYFDADNLTYTSTNTLGMFYYLGDDYISSNHNTTTTVTLHIGEHVSTLNNAFEGACISNVNFENATNITSLGERAFNGCGYLKSINLPTSVTSIGKGAFVIIGITLKIYYSGTQEDFNKISIDSSNSGHYTVVYQSN